MTRFISSIDIDARAKTGEHDDGLPLTGAEVVALEALLSASTLPAPHPRRCRASKATETKHPWNHTVHSRTAQRLHKRGLAFDHMVPELHALGNDGYIIWYSITRGGRTALARAKRERQAG